MKYVVRRMGWEYDDEIYIESAPTSIVAIYNTREEAENARSRLEKEEYRAGKPWPDPGYVRRYQSWGWLRSTSVDKSILTQFLRNECDSDLVESRSNSWSVFSHTSNWTVPMTDEDIEDFQRLVGISYYKVDKIEDEARHAFILVGDDSGGLFLSAREALLHGLRSSFRRCTNPDIFGSLIFLRGSYDELSSTPTILAELVSGCESIEYANGTLHIRPFCSDDTLIAIHGLLKEPLVKVKEIPLTVESEKQPDCAPLEPIIRSKERVLTICQTTEDLLTKEHSPLTLDEAWDESREFGRPIQSYIKGEDITNPFLRRRSLLPYRSENISCDVCELIASFLAEHFPYTLIPWAKFKVYCQPTRIVFLADGLRVSYAFSVTTENGGIPWDISRAVEVFGPALQETFLLAAEEWLRRDGEMFLRLLKEE